eukprot:TRINITY_DN2402_c0_g2_i1.p1 TRINITY_DN2402_c0_g2~~TRINITY_DN2402_c0_g2_i1.p1  ORF type:complete len:462 (+),score=126.74 TRINITY_DN2402_c0_g2_i1:87-1472(+)
MRTGQQLSSLLIALCLLSLCSCFHEYQWATYGGQGTREFRAFIDSHPFFDGGAAYEEFNSSNWKFSSVRVDKILKMEVDSLVAVGNQYLVSSTDDDVYVKNVRTGEQVFKTQAAVSVLTLNGSIHLSLKPAKKEISILRYSTASESKGDYPMEDDFDWSTLNFGGDILGYDSSVFIWGSEMENRSLEVDWTNSDWIPSEDVPVRWPSDRSKYVVWQEQSTYHTIWTLPTTSLTYNLTHSTFFPFETRWSIKTPYYPVLTLYHSRAESFIFVDQEGVKCLDVNNGKLMWKYQTTGVEQLAASDRREAGKYLYLLNDTDVTFLRFDGSSVVAERTFTASDKIQAISVLHGDEEDEEIIFLSGTSHSFFGISTEAEELFRAPGDECLSPVIFKENLTFVCANLDGVQFFRFGNTTAAPSSDGGGLAAGWIALIVIGSVLGVALLLGFAYYLFSAKKQAGPETIF